MEVFHFATVPDSGDIYRYDLFEVIHYRLLFFCFIAALIGQSLFFDSGMLDPKAFQWRFCLFDNFVFVMVILSGILILLLIDNERYFMFVDLFFLFSLYQYVFLALFWFYFFFYLPFNMLEKFKKEASVIPIIFGHKLAYIVLVQAVLTIMIELTTAFFGDPCTFSCDRYFDEAAFVVFFNLFFVTVVFVFLPQVLTHIVLFVVTSHIVIYILMFFLSCVWIVCTCGVFFFVPSIWFENNDVFGYGFQNIAAIFELQALYHVIGSGSFILLANLAFKVQPFAGRFARVVSYLFVLPIFYYCICFYNLTLFAGTYDYYWDWPWVYYQKLSAKRID